jgi:general secretion pathway protein L
VDGELDDAQAQVARLRAALRPTMGATAADVQLVKRKQTSPASVIVLDTLSKILPDGTYVVEMHIESDRLQISGLTQDAPALIRLIEQSPQFSRATFYAPTTRTAGEAGERFHIEARINAYFGDRA